MNNETIYEKIKNAYNDTKALYYVLSSMEPDEIIMAHDIYFSLYTKGWRSVKESTVTLVTLYYAHAIKMKKIIREELEEERRKKRPDLLLTSEKPIIDTSQERDYSKMSKKALDLRNSLVEMIQNSDVSIKHNMSPEELRSNVKTIYKVDPKTNQHHPVTLRKDGGFNIMGNYKNYVYKDENGDTVEINMDKYRQLEINNKFAILLQDLNFTQEEIKLLSGEEIKEVKQETKVEEPVKTLNDLLDDLI